MPRPFALMGPLIGLTLAALPLAGCVTDEYGSGYGYRDGAYGDSYNRGYYDDRYAYNDRYGYGSPYDVWYDGYYGSIDDGYWGGDGYFWYTAGNNRRDWRRGSGDHFRRQAYGNYRHYQFNDRNRDNRDDRYADERNYGRNYRDGNRDRDGGRRDGRRRGYR